MKGKSTMKNTQMGFNSGAKNGLKLEISGVDMKS
jgi:hypothetical protein